MGIGVAFEHFLIPLFEELFDHKFCLTLWFCYPKKKGYFTKFELFSSPRDQEFDQRNNCKTKRRIKCCTYLHNRSPLPHPVCPNTDTCIRNPLHVGGGGVSHKCICVCFCPNLIVYGLLIGMPH